MGRKLRHLVPALGIAVAPLGVAWAAEDLALKRVMVSTGGVAYVEYEAKVNGDSLLQLDVRLDRVDDVLKSIVVYDDRGGIGTISLPGKEPLREVFREMPFAPEALESPQNLLNALRGAEIKAVGTRDIAGRIVSVTEEAVQLPNQGGTILRHRLSLMTGDGLRQIILEDIESLRLADPRLQNQVEAALKAMAQHGERDRRRLSITTTGAGERTVRVAYVVEAPLWKTAYRLTLPPAGETRTGDLQGWAILENISGEDWKDVELTVVSGNPVTFRQALYNTYYVNRPEVPVEVLGRVLPGVDEGAVPASPQQMAADSVARKPGGRGLALAEAMPSVPLPAPAPMIAGGMVGAAMAPPPPPARNAEIAAAESSEATTQVTFRYPTPVSVANGHSLLLPIVSRTVPAERLALFQPATQPRHPLATVRLTNDSASGLPPGILTLYERGDGGAVSYVGDARLAALPVGEVRLLSFAVDQKVRIDRQDGVTQTLSRARVLDGVLQLTITDRNTTTYTIAGATREARTVVIEHPRRVGWDLVEPSASGVEMTAAAYRISREVAAGKTVTAVVTIERPRDERYELVNLNADQIIYYAGTKELAPPLRAALTRLSELRSAEAERHRAVEQGQRDLTEAGKDQQRLRDNLNAVPRDSDLYRRYLAKLGEQEDRIERLTKEITAARTAADAARKALVDYARGLKL